RALQQQEIVRIGDQQPIPITARVIAATNVKLLDAVKAGDFREDLYYRLAVIEIEIPPLRERPDDIVTLTKFIVRRHCHNLGIPVPAISEKLLEAIQSYSWPGNVRELENLCERALLLTTSNELNESHFPEYVAKCPTATNRNLGTMVENQTQLIEKALRTHNGNISKTARSLGIARSTLYRNIKKCSLGSSI
ncbi:AAA-type ATPase lid domain-containing protein, partial [Desulforhopalus singaporensis]